MAGEPNHPHDYDLIVLGAGSGGVRAARVSAQMGARVAIVEKSRAGGTCVMRGCVPKKLLVFGSHYAHDFEDAAGFGWSIGQTKHSWETLIANKNTELNRLEGVYERILRDNGVEMLRGAGRLVDANTVEVDGKPFTTDRILIATGSWPTLPDIPGIDLAITSNEALDLDRFPAAVAIVGGGYIAVEFAGIFNALGAKVTVIIRGPNLLRGFDDDLAANLAEEMEKHGITIRRETEVKSIESKGDGVCLLLSGGETLDVDQIMYATGRHPNTQGLSLEDVGVKTAKNGAIEVDGDYKTSVDNIFALGDVIDRVQLTPVAIQEAMCFASTQFGGKPKRLDYNFIPTAVFSQPPIGTVGFTERQAREKYGDIDVYVSHFRAMKHTLSGRDEKTLMKLIVDKASNRVVGLHMLGPDAGEIAQGFGVAIKAGATKADFDATVGIHPTAAEEFVTMREPRKRS